MKSHSESYKAAGVDITAGYKAVELMKEHAEGGLEYSGKVFICQSACFEDARKVADMVEEAFPRLDGPVEIFPIGTTIGTSR